MSKRTRSGALLRTLRSLMPASDISIIHERPWCSLTFSGIQICLSVQFADTFCADEAARMSAIFSEYEFDLPGQIVADIAATRAVVDQGAQCLIIDALLLDD